MKTSVEISGYTISIEENEGIISVNAIKEDEVVEEFTIQIEEGEEVDFEGEEGVRPFGEFGEEEDVFGGEEGEESEEDEDESQEESEEDEAPEAALESFQAFINKKK